MDLLMDTPITQGSVSPVLNTKKLASELKQYQQANNWRAIFELLITIIPLVALLGLAMLALNAGYWLALLLVLPASAFLVRIFVLQHDCGHQSLFAEKWQNDWVGRVLGVLTLTPYDYWLHNHALHHAGCGNLDHRGVGDIDTLTVDEYLTLTKFRQLLYKLYRNPITLFVIGPAFIFLLQQRVPATMLVRGWKPWVSTQATNVGVLALILATIWFGGLLGLFLILLPTVLFAGAAGVWLFFVQHQFEETIWDHPPHWSRTDAALYGSSHYDLPPILRWFSGNIGIHHVHHLNSRIPFFRLPQILNDYPELVDINRMTLWESLATVRLTLWDKDSRKLIGFSDLAAVN